MRANSRACAKINLDVTKKNVNNICDSLTNSAKIILVLKADGYGHGAVPIAKYTEQEDRVWGFALASLDEALMLRNNAIKKPLLVMGCLFPDEYEVAIKNDIHVMVYQLETAKALSQMAVNMNRKLNVHIKLDTGMGRIGFPITEESVSVIQEICTLPNLNVIGLSTHFANADIADKKFTHQQIADFLWMKEALLNNGIEFEYHHCSNSAGVLDITNAHMNLVRVGIAMHGIYPSDNVNHNNVLLTPTLSLISHVSHVKWVDSGSPISYGSTFITKQKSKIVTIPIGYADGYPRSLSNKGMVIINGQKLPIIGRICMDYLMVDATTLDNVKFGDQVTLIGTDGDECITVDELSNLSERFNYEFVCVLSKRIPRDYLANNQIIEQVDYFK